VQDARSAPAAAIASLAIERENQLRAFLSSDSAERIAAFLN